MYSAKDYLRDIATRADHIYEKLKEAINVLRSILEQLGGDPEEAVDSIIANYPRTGKRDLPIGIITIDTRRGKALFPDGTAEDMSASIPDQVCRSILIYANAEIDLILLDEDKINFFIEDRSLLERLRANIGPVKSIEENARELEGIYQELIEARRE